MTWNQNIDEAPRGQIVDSVVNHSNGKDVTVSTFVPDRILAVTSRDEVILSYWWTDGKGVGHWSGFSDTSPPVAWMKCPEYP